MHTVSSRRFLKTLGIGAAASAFPIAALADQPKGARVIVVGGGFGGATCAKYLRRFDPSLRVTLIEPYTQHLTCPGSNWVIGGTHRMEDLAQGYDALRDHHGVEVLTNLVMAINADKRRITLADDTILGYDRLVLSPGIDFKWNVIEGHDHAAGQILPHAWKAGPQTVLLRKQIEAMPDGGVYVITAPGNPYRCPPGPYERAALVADYFKRHKPRSKILILDAKDNFTKKDLFIQGWKALYGDMIEWVAGSEGGMVERVDPKTRTAYTQGGLLSFKADVLNVVPPQKAAAIASQAGLTDEQGWCPVDQASFESKLAPGIFVIGDAAIAGAMPKSGHSANSHGKLAAVAVIRSLEGAPMETPSHVNTCYSLVGPEYGISIAAVYRTMDGEIKGVPDSGGVSPIDAPEWFRKLEATYTYGWYASITQDTWG